jgi:hypothetical protein
MHEQSALIFLSNAMIAVSCARMQSGQPAKLRGLLDQVLLDVAQGRTCRNSVRKNLTL